jgi:4-diphosphocytidyl-2-C-methyl-D-erythritol kinase
VELDPTERVAIAAAIGSDVPFFLGTGPALVTGRGETVERLDPPQGDLLGVLLVTAAVGLPTGDVYRAYAAGARSGTGSTRITSEHLAAELRGGLRSRALYDRAGVLAAANDLAPAAAAVLPAIVPFRRALIRLLNRPVGLAGSGPTQWVLYPSIEGAAAAATRVREAFAAGSLPSPGTGPPTVIATRLAAAPHAREIEGGSA